MVSIHEEPDCGNSPRKEILRDLMVALAQRDVEHLDVVLAEDVSWTVVGERTETGREAAREMALALPEVDELTFGTFLTHGRGAGVDGVLRLADGTETAFCHVLRFKSTAKTAKVANINSYLIKTSGEA
ncbi:nuclear transport factor 2 family protein [Arthrobacter rhombi]|uniref:nuclear transport factor 2 family protein n=1 Tax=Arthrobacter rhombi TaxID=71253 RepID=UPI003FCF6BA2